MEPSSFCLTNECHRVLECTHYSADHCLSLSLASDMLAQFFLGDESKWGAGKEDSTATTTTCDLKSCHLVVCSFRLPCSVNSSSSSSSIGKHYRAVPVTICSEATLWCVCVCVCVCVIACSTTTTTSFKAADYFCAFFLSPVHLFQTYTNARRTEFGCSAGHTGFMEAINHTLMPI